jgi:hypothetical protein
VPGTRALAKERPLSSDDSRHHEPEQLFRQRPQASQRPMQAMAVVAVAWIRRARRECRELQVYARFKRLAPDIGRGECDDDATQTLPLVFIRTQASGSTSREQAHADPYCRERQRDKDSSSPSLPISEPGPLRRFQKPRS